MPAAVPTLKIKLQIYCDDEIAMGPGKADLLEAIEREGSISGAARALGMSYRRAWMLVDTMNRCWTEPMVETTPGGAARGGARISPFGREVLRHYRTLQDRAFAIRTSADWGELQRFLRAQPKEHQKA